MNKELMRRSTGEHLGRITISIGVATLGSGDNPRSLIERADVCLYGQAQRPQPRDRRDRSRGQPSRLQGRVGAH
jgi:diguanylate cyclase